MQIIPNWLKQKYLIWLFNRYLHYLEIPNLVESVSSWLYEDGDIWFSIKLIQPVDNRTYLGNDGDKKEYTHNQLFIYESVEDFIKKHGVFSYNHD